MIAKPIRVDDLFVSVYADVNSRSYAVVARASSSGPG